jgi:hypothetical protein
MRDAGAATASTQTRSPRWHRRGRVSCGAVSRRRRSAQGILAEDTKVYATTAASEKESSFGTYCDEDAVVNGTNLHTQEPVSTARNS